MYTVLIVDDDLLVREMLTKIIDWEKLGYEIIGEAGDGNEAIELYHKLLPDVIILDMSMPQLDGLEVIRHIREIDKKTKILVISCHDDFYYVKEAMRLLASEYILKHLLSEEIISETLLKIKENLEERKDQNKLLKEDIRLKKEAAELIKTKALKKLLTKSYISIEDEEELATHFPEITQKTFCMILFKVYQFHKVVKSYEPNGKEIFYFILNNMVLELIKEEIEHNLLNIEDGYYVMLINMEAERESEVKRSLKSVINRVHYSAKQYLNIDTAFIMSSNRISYRNLFNTFQHLLTGKKLLFYDENTTTVDVGCEMINTMTLSVLETDIQIMKESINNGDIRAVISMVKQNLNKIKKKKIDPDQCKHYIIRWVSQIGGYITYRFKIKDFTWLKAVENIRNCVTFSELVEIVDNYFKEITSFIHNNKFQDTDNEYVKEAVRYINIHYKNEISLQKVADHININPAYLSHIFKQETGMNYVDYLKVVRMEKACEYLRFSDLKIKEIGEAVGIHNRKYFSKIFKEQTGVSPLEYRRGYFE